MPSRQLIEVEYPIYSVVVTPDGNTILGGGGGNSKTGVPNIMEMHKNDDAFTLEQALIAGLDEIGRLYTYDTDDVGADPSTAQIFTAVKEQVTDFATGEEGGYQKVARFSRSGDLFLTGGADGVMRLWRYPSFEKIREVKASDGLELKDAAFSPDDKHIATVATRAKELCVWDVETGESVKRLQFKGKGPGLYTFNACRFITVEGNKMLLALATLPRNPSYLVLWETSTWTVVHKKWVDEGPCTCMEVSPGETFIAVGTADGNIVMLDAINFKRFHTAKGVHPLFITCVAFAPGSTAVLSASVDRRCVRTDVMFTETDYDLMTILRGAMRMVLFAILVYWLLKTFLGPKYGLN